MSERGKRREKELEKGLKNIFTGVVGPSTIKVYLRSAKKNVPGVSGSLRVSVTHQLGKGKI